MLWFSMLLVFAGVVLPSLVLKQRLVGLGVGVVVTLLYGALSLLLLPAYTGPFWGMGMPLILGLVIGEVFLSIFFLNPDRVDKKGEKAEGISFLLFGAILVVAVLAVLVCGVASTALVRPYAKSAMIGQIEEKQLDPGQSFTDVGHLRMVCRDQAIALAKKTLGQQQQQGAIGSRFEVDIEELTLQKVGGKLWWVCPLRYRDFFVWASGDPIPGYVKIDAEDPNHTGELVTTVDGQKVEINYSPSAYWGHDLDRVLWMNGFSTYERADFSFEVDDSWHPQWVVSILRPSVMYTCRKVCGVAMVDPDSGVIEFLSDEVPEWVDRVVPAKLAEINSQNWGCYRKGFWNTVISKRDVMSASGGAIEVFGVDNQIYWHVGISSANGADDSLVAYIQINSRTNAARIYWLAGVTPEAAQKALNSQVSNYQGWSAQEVIPYVLYGHFAYVSPIVSANGQFQRLGIVEGTNVNLVALGSSEAEALRAFKARLAQGGNAVNPDSAVELQVVEGTVRRIGTDTQNGTAIFFVLLNEVPEKLYVGGTATSSRLPITKEGDKVQISVMETTEEVVQMTKFENQSL